jgi:WD40 repeat protein
MTKGKDGLKLGRRAFLGTLGGGVLASASGRRKAYAEEEVKGQSCGDLKAHSSFVNSVAFSPNGTLLASGTHDDKIHLWALPDGEPNWCLFDPALVSGETKVIKYRQISSEMVCVCDTITVPATTSLPGGTICTCNTIAVGTKSRSSGGGGHYWYPN